MHLCLPTNVHWDLPVNDPGRGAYDRLYVQLRRTIISVAFIAPEQHLSYVEKRNMSPFHPFHSHIGRVTLTDVLHTTMHRSFTFGNKNESNVAQRINKVNTVIIPRKQLALER